MYLHMSIYTYVHIGIHNMGCCGTPSPEPAGVEERGSAPKGILYIIQYTIQHARGYLFLHSAPKGVGFVLYSILYNVCV